MENRHSLLPIDKSFEELMAKSIAELQKTPLNHQSPGGVARLILAKMNEQLADFYKILKVNHMSGVLSRSSGGSVDLIGELLNCRRIGDESDQAYKYRISQQTMTLAQANETAVRLAALSVEGVEDVLLRAFTNGVGSFSVYVITGNPEPNPTLIEKVNNAVRETQAFGVRAFVLQPRIVEVELRARMVFSQRVSGAERNILRAQGTRIMRTHLNTLGPGESLRVEMIRRELINLDEDILDIEFYHFIIKGQTRLFVAQEAAWNERFFESSKTNAVIIT